MTSLTRSQQADLVATAHRLADAARPETLRHFRSAGLGVDVKGETYFGDFDPVTAADRSAEQAMRAVLSELRPDDGILGEEFGTKPGTTGLTWVLDPIDGTRGFVAGTPTWGVLISVADETGPLFGIIDQPYIGERFEGGFGVAHMTGRDGTRPLAVRPTRQVAEATVLTTFPEVGRPEEGRAFQAVSRQARLTRYGLDCYAYALLALGQVDLVIEAGLAAYDIQAPIAVIEAAGGLVTDWEGNPVHAGGRAIAAATPELHAEAMAILQRDLAD